MELKRDHEGWNCYTDDAAKLYLSHTGYGPVPTELRGFAIGHSVEHATPSQAVIEIARLELIGQGRFGEARPAGLYPRDRTKWTGDYAKFGIYAYRPRFGRAEVVIIRTDGAGASVYVVKEIDALKTWSTLCGSLQTEILWDLCMTLTATYQTGRFQGIRRMKVAFAEGRLKKRRKKGQVFVDEIDSPVDVVTVAYVQ